jgi:hypothetical protein
VKRQNDQAGVGDLTCDEGTEYRVVDQRRVPDGNFSKRTPLSLTN